MVLLQKIKQTSALAAAGLLLLASVAPLLIARPVSAYTLLGDREIRMSTSANGATGATYRVEFDVTTAGDIGGVVVTFCAGSPIINDTVCAVPTDFVVGTGIANAGAGDVDLSGYTSAFSNQASSGATNNTVILSSASPETAAASDTISFELTNVTNPATTNTTFFARIYTYEVNTHATGYTLANPSAGGAPVDAGGVALSTAEEITVTARVQERLRFCVYTSALNDTDCAGVSGSDVTLGDGNGVLDETTPYLDKSTKYNIYTNAANGAAIRAKATGTLTSGGNTISALAAPATSSAGTEQFGVCTYRDTTTAAGLSITANYDGDGNCAGTAEPSTHNSAEFYFPVGALASTYGDQIAEKAAGLQSTGVVVFLGNISPTTPPGIYTSTMTFIATGNY
jgi:hypothetical protein